MRVTRRTTNHQGIATGSGAQSGSVYHAETFNVHNLVQHRHRSRLKGNEGCRIVLVRLVNRNVHVYFCACQASVLSSSPIILYHNAPWLT
eukprot:scaffold6306_cov135-Amphora_coffeaeformis.AAC.4